MKAEYQFCKEAIRILNCSKIKKMEFFHEPNSLLITFDIWRYRNSMGSWKSLKMLAAF